MGKKKYVLNKPKSAAVVLSMCMGISAVASPAATAIAAPVSTDDTDTKESKQKGPDFPSVYPDEALAKLSEEELDARIEGLIKAMTQEEKFSLLGGDGSNSSSTKGYAGRLNGVPRLGVPYLEMHDGPSGVSYTEDTTNPPIHQLLAATWDEDSAYAFGDIEGSEAAAIGANAQLGSQFDITRVPQFGRGKDQMGEDAYLLSKLAAQETKGIQDNNVVAVAKHYAAFAKNVSPAKFYNVEVSEQALHELYLPGFESAVKAGAGGIMSSYGAVNNEKMSANKYLNVDVLRDMFGFKGFNVTDWGGNYGFTIDKGTDIEMPSTSKNTQAAAEEKIANGELTQDTVDDAVRHVLHAMGDAGYLGLVQLDENGVAMADENPPETIYLDEDKAELARVRKENNLKARSIAEKGGVLLKNEDNTLPLKSDETVSVSGIGGLNLLSGIGGERSYGTVSDMTSPYEALVDLKGSDNVVGAVGIDKIGETIPNEYLYTSEDAANGIEDEEDTDEEEKKEKTEEKEEADKADDEVTAEDEESVEAKSEVKDEDSEAKEDKSEETEEDATEEKADETTNESETVVDKVVNFFKSVTSSFRGVDVVEAAELEESEEEIKKDSPVEAADEAEDKADESVEEEEPVKEEASEDKSEDEETPKEDSKDDEKKEEKVKYEKAHGAVRTYGVKSEGSSGSFNQGQMWGQSSASTTGMKNADGEIVAGTFACIDDVINFNTGVDKDKDSWWHNGTDGTAFPQSGGTIATEKDGNWTDEREGQSYTWTTYLKAPETGKYSIVLGGIGGSISAKVTGEGVSGSMSTASVREGEQWPSSSYTMETGMDVSSCSVNLTEGEVYKITIQATTVISEKDMQVALNWITPSMAADNYTNAISAAKKNDKTVVFVNYQASDSGSSGFGQESSSHDVSDISMRLDSEQEDFIEDLAKAAHDNGHKIIVVLNNDTAVTMSSWIDDVDAVLEMYYPGQGGGVATAELLTGAVNPSGHLAYTIQKYDSDTIITASQEAYDREDVNEGKDDLEGKTKETSYYDEGIITGYRWFDEEGIEPLYDFGYGLSYTEFEYTDMSVKRSSEDKEKVGYDVTFTVTNTGDVKGSDVAQIYLGAPTDRDGIDEDVQFAKYQLAGFQRVEDLEPGESREVTIHVSERSLSYWNTNGELKENAEGVKDKWTIAEGERTIYVAEAEDELVLSKTVDVSESKPTPTPTPEVTPTPTPEVTPTPTPTPEVTPTPTPTPTPKPAGPTQEQKQKVIQVVQYVVKQVVTLVRNILSYLRGLWG